MIYPENSKTCVVELSGVSNYVCEPDSSTVYTILGLGSQQSGTQSDTSVFCGNSIVAKNYATSLPYHQINYLCDKEISVQKTGGGDSSTTTIVYSPYNIASESSTYDLTASLSYFQEQSVYSDLIFNGIIILLVSFGILLNYFKR